MNQDVGVAGADRDDMNSEGIFSESERDDSITDSPPLASGEFDSWQSTMGLKSFGEGLNAAAKAIFPRHTRPRYSNVHVLMLRWEEPGSPIPPEILKLLKLFDEVYHFDVELWKIPSEDSQGKVDRKIRAFVSLGGDSDEDLKIVYYAGHTNGIEQSIRSREGLAWNNIHTTLQSSHSDVLILSDSPLTGPAQRLEGNGVTELIAASGNSNSDMQPFSFTGQLETELRELSRMPSFSVGNLYHNLFCRIHSENGDLSSPIYHPLGCDDASSPRSIRLAIHRRSGHSSTVGLSGDNAFEVQPPNRSIANDGFSTIPTFLHSSAGVDGEVPRMAFAVRLQKDFRVQDISSSLFEEWLQQLPSSVAEVKIEAAFHSHSSLLIVSVPICMSIYMPHDPAVVSLGPITSFNQVLSRVPIPNHPPTPRPDSFEWDNLPPQTNIIDPNSLSPRASTEFNQRPGARLRRNSALIRNGNQPRNEYFPRDSRSSSIETDPETPSLRGAMPSPNISHEIPTSTNHSGDANGPQTSGRSKIRSYSDEAESRFPRISKDVELLSNEYDCVVIGSGYGGGVAASRMARAGQSVCLLERGKEKWPGEYPSGHIDALKQLHISGQFAPGKSDGIVVDSGDPTGLYHLICGKGQNAFVGNGLGGTSLLNANIFLEADDKTMAMPCWPKELQEKDSLKPYYERAAHVLEPEPYPEDWPDLPKLTMLQRQAKALGWEEKFKRPRQTTRFRGGPNSTGVEMYPSTLTGMDSTGVNDGSKSSTLVNYLADAWNWGAEMFCECEVRYVKKHPEKEGYLVFFAWHGGKRGAFNTSLYEDLMWVHAKKCVFLGAGAIGTTEILLRSKKLGLSMSNKVGINMSGNGDILAFGYNTDTEVNGIARQFPSPYKPVGPTITGMIDCRDQENPLDGFVIEEGAVPKALSLFFQTMLEMMPGNQLPKGQGLADKVQHALAQLGSRFLGPYFRHGSIERTQTYLIMSHDSNQAILTMKNDKPMLEFLGVGNSAHVKRLHGFLKDATEAVGGTYVNSPFYGYLGQQEITVHPIGGACMSYDGTGEHGVTNHFGEVFAGIGEETHPGLIVTDAAVIPTALGVNPFATITALAERSVEHAANERIGRDIDFVTRNKVLDLFAEPGQFHEGTNVLTRTGTSNLSDARRLVQAARAAKANGFGFSEVMSGYIHVGDGIEGEKLQDYQTAAKTAKGLCEEARFFLSVKTYDTQKTVYQADHKAMLTGTFTCAGLAGSPFMVQRGNFHLFNVYHEAPGTKNLRYEFEMTSTKGEKYHFSGFKVVDSSVALAPWKFWQAASTLYVTIKADGGTKVLGRGMMHIKPSDFLSEILTLKPSGRDIWAKMQSTMSFMNYFARQSASLFLAPLMWQQYPLVSYSGFINDTTPEKTIKIVASDGVKTLLHMWNPQNPDIEPKNLFFIPGASVDEQIFSLPTIQVNAVNYFTRAGYRVFVTVHRICQLRVAEDNHTTYDSRLDIKACYQWIRKTYGEEPVYTIAHCMGAVAYSCGLLDGTIPASWVKGISCSQVFMNPMWATLNLAKASAGPIPFDKLYNWFGGGWFSCSSTRDDSYFQQLVNQVLRFYPDSRDEICNNVSCHRCSLVFGRLWNHRNLNEGTHRQINRFFGGVNMTLLHLLMQMGRRGVVTSNAPLCTDLTTDENIARLDGIPIMLFSGAENKVLSPESTDRSYSILREKFGMGDYERFVIQGYGHLDCWMGRRSYRDVFPLIREQVDKVCRGTEYKYVEPKWEDDWDTWRDRGSSSSSE